MGPFDEHWALEMAILIAKTSPCQSKRGVIIWSRERGAFSYGVNAPPLPFTCNGSESCRANCAKTAVHAEQNAIIDFLESLEFGVEDAKVELLHVKVVDGKAVFSEKPSCWQCSKLILATPYIKSVWLYQKEGLVRYSTLDFHTKTLENCGLSK